MQIIDPSFKFTKKPKYFELLSLIEEKGRICYRSEPDNSQKFVKMLIKSGHHSVLEHGEIGVTITTDRGVSHELVRHRIGAAYSQESTRYCNYSKSRFENEISVIKPAEVYFGTESYDIWRQAMLNCEAAYLDMIQHTSAQNARSVLPNSLATRIGVTMNIRSWRHFFDLRCSVKAHPDMRYIARKMYYDFAKIYPVFFEDLKPEMGEEAR